MDHSVDAGDQFVYQRKVADVALDKGYFVRDLGQIGVIARIGQCIQNRDFVVWKVFDRVMNEICPYEAGTAGDE